MPPPSAGAVFRLRLAGSSLAAIERLRTNRRDQGLMSDHSHAARPPMRAETPEAFLADRQRFWGSFTHFTLGSVIFMIVLLVLMAIFLL